jgi:hypothetical protein
VLKEEQKIKFDIKEEKNKLSIVISDEFKNIMDLENNNKLPNELDFDNSIVKKTKEYNNNL